MRNKTADSDCGCCLFFFKLKFDVYNDCDKIIKVIILDCTDEVLGVVVDML